MVTKVNTTVIDATNASVSYATTAGTASTAGSASYASSAGSASYASSAGSASSASYASSAGSATTAGTASALTSAAGSAPSYAVRAFVNFNGQGAVAIRESVNVSSITDSGTGRYVVNFISAMTSTTYTCVGCCSAIPGRGQAALMPNEISNYLVEPTTTAQAVFTCHDAGGVMDAAWVMVAILD